MTFSVAQQALLQLAFTWNPLNYQEGSYTDNSRLWPAAIADGIGTSRKTAHFSAAASSTESCATAPGPMHIAGLCGQLQLGFEAGQVVSAQKEATSGHSHQAKLPMP